MITLKKARSWALIAALILMVLGVVAYGSYITKPSNGHHKAECVENIENVAQDDKQVPTIISGDYGQAIADKERAREKKRQEYLELQRQCSDLEAQWAMADITWYAFMAGILGIVLVFATLVYTARASRSDARARRAWVWLEDIEATQNQNANDKVTSIDFNPIILNSGETPSQNTISKCYLSVKPTIEEAIKDIEDSKIYEGGHPMVVAPKSPTPLTGSNLKVSQIRAMKRGAVCVFLMTVRYRDLFDPKIERFSESFRQLEVKPREDESGKIIGVQSSHGAILGYPDKIT